MAVVLRDADDLRRLVEANPFAGLEVTPQARPHVTFLKREPLVKPDLPWRVCEKGYEVLGIVERAVCSVVDLSGGTTPDLMQRLDREFGADVTTRSWGTVERVMRALS